MKLPKCQVEEVDVLMRNILELLLTKLSLPLSYDTYSIVIESASLFSSKVICNDTFRQEQMQLVN